ncbi:DUF664 domain-containing protein [Kitasatospora sp. NPDC059571]|uniref:mycothiol transferase n=1 Tax=Kitasatospora sp. NPDC059571 TaxID=3346871 RepID=UPI0036B24720
MNSADLLADAFDRIRESVHDAVRGLDADALSTSPEVGANTVAWLVWHLTRIQDDHVADVAGAEQLWTADGWADRFDLPFPPGDTGYGHGPAEVAAVRVDSPKLLTGYHDAVHARTLDYVRTLRAAALERVVDRRWDPPVTLGVRLISVVADDLQHAGQAAYVRGMLLRRPTRG